MVKFDTHVDLVIEGQELPSNWTAPVQLVRSSPKLEVTAEGKQVLAELGTAPVDVTSIAGLYRTGKSFLSNALCDRIGAGFTVGNTVQACTEGIWISYSRCAKTIELVLDIEGSGNTQNHTEHDTLLFTLAVLISSCFVYNSKGVIDEAAISKLSVVTAMAAHIDPEDLESPRFVWVLRDF